MGIEEIKQKALALNKLENKELNQAVLELKNIGVPFLGCVVFVQINQKVSLLEAKTKTLELECWTKKEKEENDFNLNLMLNDFEVDN